MKATTGTHAAMWINLAATLLGAVDATGIVNVVPPQYAWIGVALGAANTIAHAMTGNAPIVGTKPV